MIRYEVIVIGAGPAGLSAAIEAASRGLEVAVFDENKRSGGQLFKQIHKFFGSKEHQARKRGFRIGEDLLKEAQKLGVKVILEAQVIGMFPNRQIAVMIDDAIEYFVGNTIILATGATENTLTFPGWTLPGVIGAGAAQTMMNLHGVRPGNRVLMVGSGNVGVVVGYQLIQAGCELAGVIDAAPKIGGYGVHAAKLARMGVPFYMSHTVRQAHGKDYVTGVTIQEVDNTWNPVPGSEKFINVDVICIAVGLSPLSQLARLSGCLMEEIPAKGGLVPKTDAYGRTTVPGIFVAGDVAGIEEASSAMIQGRMAGNVIANQQGYISKDDFEKQHAAYQESLAQLRSGISRDKKAKIYTEEGQLLSVSLLKKGFLDEEEIGVFPGVPIALKRKQGITPVIECTQNIPCNPCQDVCPKGCIKIGSKITNLPLLEESAACSGCGLCVISCPGQAIFLVDETYEEGFAAVSLAYELWPMPTAGTKGGAYDRSGTLLGDAVVLDVRLAKGQDGTALVKIKVPAAFAMKARFFRPK